MSVSEEELVERVAFLKVLADKNRLRILGLLTEREYSVKDLAIALDVTEPTVSHHLSALRRAEVIEMRPAGTAHYYRLRMEHIHTQLRELTAAHRQVPEEFEGDDFARKTLQRFVVGGKLKELPNTYKKWLVILRYIAPTFEIGVLYPEKQVNEILKQFHPDCASLRRYLVDNGFMQRENSVYWRVDSPQEKPALLAGANLAASQQAAENA